MEEVASSEHVVLYMVYVPLVLAVTAHSPTDSDVVNEGAPVVADELAEELPMVEHGVAKVNKVPLLIPVAVHKGTDDVMRVADGLDKDVSDTVVVEYVHEVLKVTTEPLIVPVATAHEEYTDCVEVVSAG